MTNPDKTLARIRKLLAKAEDPSVTTEEAEAYNTKAAELIAAYGIDRALLADSDPGTDTPGDKVIILDPPYALDKAQLLSGIAYELRCRTVQRTRYPGGRKEISLHLFGYASDLERIELLYTSLLIQAAHGMTTAVIPWNEHPAAYRRSWLAGFTQAVARRLRAAEQHAEQAAEQQHASGGKSVALVLVRRSARIDQLVTAEYPRLARGQARQLSGSGRIHGYNAGQRADLGTTSRVRPAASRSLSNGGS